MQPEPRPGGPSGLASPRTDSAPARLHKRGRERASPPRRSVVDSGRQPDHRLQRTWPRSEQPWGTHQCAGAPSPRDWQHDSYRGMDCRRDAPCIAPLSQRHEHSDWTMSRMSHADDGSADRSWPTPCMGASLRRLKPLCVTATERCMALTFCHIPCDRAAHGWCFAATVRLHHAESASS